MLMRTKVRSHSERTETPPWAQLAERKGALVNLLFLYPGTPDRPVQEMPGRILYARSNAVCISLDTTMPMGLNRKTRFAVEVLIDGAMLLFQSQPVEGEPFGGGIMVLTPPKRMAKVQRRKFARAPVRVAVHIFSGETKLGTATSVDLSAGGMRFSTSLPLTYGQRLRLSLQAPDGERFENLPGQVIRIEFDTKPPNYAVRFDELPDYTESSLIQVVFKVQMMRNPK